MKITNGKIIILIGVIHTTFTPFVYTEQFEKFTHQLFFKINNGFMDTSVDYKTFAAFWCLYFGLILFPLGILLDSVEKKNIPIPKPFILSYLVIILIGVYMVPFGGMTLFMLPHVICMLIRHTKTSQTASSKMDTGQGE
ncbi:MAG: DUF6463 family protein [Desulfobacteraceae bacterium]|jgi:hypothetical protein